MGLFIRAVDNRSDTLDFMLSERRDEDAGSSYFCESLFWASQAKQAAKT
ncbi:hypothetical protein BAZMOX_105338_0 [methanotrophic endosymbiont of Bathymodiolus azoricus (Menez Gwen)]|nr:hypothetical protein BAZMOX_105338_0 [methanotrophic endosymbiont of Bathymodiolus azoricus (Menez Gwen)]